MDRMMPIDIDNRHNETKQFPVKQLLLLQLENYFLLHSNALTTLQSMVKAKKTQPDKALTLIIYPKTYMRVSIRLPTTARLVHGLSWFLLETKETH